MAFTRPCDRCPTSTAVETALCLSCLSYTCSPHWGTGPGTEHMCGFCADQLHACACIGDCPSCRIVTAGVQPQRESEMA